MRPGSCIAADLLSCWAHLRVLLLRVEGFGAKLMGTRSLVPKVSASNGRSSSTFLSAKHIRRGLSLSGTSLALQRSPKSWLLYLDHLESNGSGLYAKACEFDLEGIVAKWKDGSYGADDRRSSWVKIK